MKSWREDPDSEENQRATKQNQREVFTLKMTTNFMPAQTRRLRRVKCGHCAIPAEKDPLRASS
jgi:hypothetical protein